MNVHNCPLPVLCGYCLCCSIRNDDGVHASLSDGVFVLSLPLGFVVVLEAAVQLAEDLSQTRGQGGLQELDVALRAHVQDAVDALGQVTLDLWH